MLTTPFRPEIDGYAFSNSWTLDDAERRQVRQIVSIAVPAAAGVLSPIIAALSPVVIATLGPALLLLGPFLPILACMAPMLASKLIDSIADDVADNAHGWCGGMSYSAMDYYLRNWVLPCGNDSNDQPQPIVQGGTVGSEWLRSYIWQRQLDSELANGEKFLSWIAMTALFGTYGHEWVRDQTVSEMPTLEAKIASGTPWPIGLLGSGSSPTASHFVVATSFDQTGSCIYRIGVYDNRYPDQTCYIDVDLSGSEANITESTGDAWQGLFCADYTPAQPNPALVAVAALTLSPPWFTTVKQSISATFGADYRGFHNSRPVHLAIGHAAFVDGEEATAPVAMSEDESRQPQPAIVFSEGQSGTFQFVPKVAVFPRQGAVAQASYKTLPNPDGSAIAPQPYVVNPSIPIKAIGSPTDSCVIATVEGGTMTLLPDVSYFPPSMIVGYSWSVSGGMLASGNQPTLKLANLPAAPAVVHVQLAVSLSNGTDATGKLDFTTIDAGIAGRLTLICHMRQGLFRNPIAVIPFNRGDPAPDGLRNPALRRAIDPAAMVQTMERMVQSMRRLLEKGAAE